MPDFAIETRDLSKQFDRHLAVSNVDLQIGYGEVYGLIGPNGAGKTTLIRMLAGIEEPTTGAVYFNGEPMRSDRPNRRIQQRLGYLPDDFPLYDDLTVWDYLDYFARLYRLRDPTRSRRLFDVLDLVQLVPKRNSPISTLSRGMKQRLSLARTVIHEPILLLLDEPVSGLDPIARQQFRDIVKVLQEAGMTVLISSHVLSDLAELCTSVGIMELGYLVESASLDSLYAQLSQQQIEISILGNDFDPLLCELRNCPQVKGWEQRDRQLVLQFDGSEGDRASLLQQLVRAGIAIDNFHSTREDLETIFLKLGHKQAS